MATSCLRRMTLFLIVSTVGSLAAAAEYDPLRVANDVEVRSLDLTIKDAKRDREIPIRVYLPPRNASASSDQKEKGESASPAVLFSHGLGGSRAGSPFLGKHWAARGSLPISPS